MIVPIAKSMDVLFEEQEGIKVTPLLTSSAQSWGEVNLEDDNIQKQEDDREGPLVIAASIEKQISDKNNPGLKNAKIFVSGSAAFLSDEILSYSLGNANKDFFMNVIGWMTDQEEIITISPKNIAREVLIISPVQQIVFMLLLFLGVPLIVFILGGVVWIKRRHL